jgi:hypothetical protein
MLVRVLIGCGALALAAVPAPVAAGEKAAALAAASARLFQCFDELAVEAERRNWSELAYYRAISRRCDRELTDFVTLNAADPADRADARRRLGVTRSAIRGALVDAALDYGRAAAFRHPAR